MLCRNKYTRWELDFCEPKETSLNWRLCIVLFMSNKVSHPLSAWWGMGRSVASPRTYVHVVPIVLWESVWSGYSSSQKQLSRFCQAVWPHHTVDPICFMSIIQVTKTQDARCKKLACFNPTRSADAATDVDWSLCEKELTRLIREMNEKEIYFISWYWSPYLLEESKLFQNEIEGDIFLENVKLGVTRRRRRYICVRATIQHG